jgi:hypothetical protein
MKGIKVTVTFAERVTVTSLYRAEITKLMYSTIVAKYKKCRRTEFGGKFRDQADHHAM